MSRGRKGKRSKRQLIPAAQRVAESADAAPRACMRFRARRVGKVERAHLALQGLDVSLTLTAEVAQFGRQVLDHLTPPRRQHVAFMPRTELGPK